MNTIHLQIQAFKAIISSHLTQYRVCQEVRHGKLNYFVEQRKYPCLPFSSFKKAGAALPYDTPEQALHSAAKVFGAKHCKVFKAPTASKANQDSKGSMALQIS